MWRVLTAKDYRDFTNRDAAAELAEKLQKRADYVTMEVTDDDGKLIDFIEYKIELTELKCQRCEHKWNPRRPVRPIICPKCKSPYWDKPRKSKK